MEVLEISPDWSVEIQTPGCDLHLEGCGGPATQGMRVHGCTFHYACDNCTHTFIRRVSKGYSIYRNMRCGSCKKKFGKGDKYFSVVTL